MLLTYAFLVKASCFTISMLFKKSLNLLWLEGVQHHSILLLSKDVTPYLVTQTGAVNTFSVKKIHFTCTANELYLIAEKVRL